MLEILITVALVFVAFLLFRRYFPTGNWPNGPGGYPIVGNFFQLGNRPHETFMQMREQYDDIFSLKLGAFSTVVINGLDNIREALIDKKEVFAGRPPFYAQFVNSEGIAFNSYSNKWSVLKKTLVKNMHAVTYSNTMPMSEFLRDEMIHMVVDISKRGGKPFDPRLDIYLSALNVAYQLCYGKGENIRELDEHQFKEFLVREDPVIRILSLGQITNVIPWLRHIFPSNKKQMDDMNLFVASLIENKVAEHKKTFIPDSLRDITDSFIALENLTPEMMKVGLNVRNLYFLLQEIVPASFDTTATSLLWTILHLVQNMHVQEKMHAVIDNVFGDTCIQLQDRDRIPYIEAVILESMRVNPPIPMGLPKSAIEDTEFKGYHIPKGTIILTNLFSTTRDKNIWERPHDFYPEHFINKDGTLDKEKEKCIFPFGLGQRKCPGESFARAELFMTLANLMQRFILLPVDGEIYDMNGVIGLTDSPKPFKIIAKER